ncbi:MAG TPA: hypothetical protein V6D50_10050 [Chroococcales cyanobacterium]
MLLPTRSRWRNVNEVYELNEGLGANPWQAVERQLNSMPEECQLNATIVYIIELNCSSQTQAP